MEAQFFVYTRGYDISNDYKLMFSPSNDFCPDDIRKYFLQLVRGTINVEQYQGSLRSPRWLFCRHNGFSLWGMGIMNSELSEISNTDYTGRAVRGFFGMVLKNGTFTKLPYDITFWKSFYKDYLSPLWMVDKEKFKQKGIHVKEPFENYCCIVPNHDGECKLNTQPDITVIWGELTEKDMFAAAMATENNISCVGGLNEREHAYNHDYWYNNAIVEGITETESRRYVEEKKIEPKKESRRTQVVKEKEKCETSKKAFCPKVITMLAIVILLLLIFFRMAQRTKNSPSGGIYLEEKS